MTNAQKIRSLSDEELAEALKGGCRNDADCEELDTCFMCWLAWLQQEATICD